jgi:histidine triad (HIT) family protein
MSECVFCNIITGKLPAQIIAQNEQIIVIKDIAPKAPIHYLIIPKKHIIDIRTFARDDRELGAEIIAMAQQLSQNLQKCPFKLVISNGAEVGQCVFHVHAHFLSGARLSEMIQI